MIYLPSANSDTQAETVAFLRRVLLRHSQGMRLRGKSILGLPTMTHKVLYLYNSLHFTRLGLTDAERFPPRAAVVCVLRFVMCFAGRPIRRRQYHRGNHQGIRSGAIRGGCVCVFCFSPFFYKNTAVVAAAQCVFR